MNPNVLHLLGGIVILAAGVMMLWLRQFVGNGLTLVLGSVIAAGGVEVYQYVRREGVPSASDALISAAPGVLAGLVWWRAWP